MTQSFSDAMAGFSPALPVAVAFSGGADSSALLLACAQKWPGQVVAIHIHHGLQAAADDFQSHCERTCAALNVPLLIRRVNARHASGESPENIARIARYEAFDALAPDYHSDVAINNVADEKFQFRAIALAQHADDQIETMLLALSRGAGLAGLAAMPRQWQRAGVAFFRPLLSVSATEVRAWLAEQGMDFVEDPTNADQRFTRNRTRARLLPALQDVFPAFRDTFARTAAHAAQAQGLLLEVAVEDLRRVGRPGDGHPVIARVQEFSRARQANLLRQWLKSRYMTVPSAAQLDELLDQIAACTTRGHQIQIKVGSGFVQRRGDVLDWYNP